MSQPSSSTEPFAPFAPPELTPKQMLGVVEEYCQADAPPTPLKKLAELLRDPFARKDRFRPRPLVVSLALFLLTGLGTFIYFSFWSH